jgi:hypothetical protein
VAAWVSVMVRKKQQTVHGPSREEILSPLPLPFRFALFSVYNGVSQLEELKTPVGSSAAFRRIGEDTRKWEHFVLVAQKCVEHFRIPGSPTADAGQTGQTGGRVLLLGARAPATTIAA